MENRRTRNPTTTEPNLTYTFTTPGVYKVRLKVTDTSGLLDYRTRKITVEEAPIPDGGPVAYFKFMTEDGELTTYFFGKKGINEIASGTYEILGTGITANLNSFYTRTENIFDSLPRALYQVKLTLTDTAGLSSSFTHNVDLTTDEGAPFVKFDVVQSGVLQAFVNAVDSFDPYEFSEIEIDWGDGSDPDVDENFFFSHSYSAAGTYPVTVKLIGDSGKVTSLTKNVTVDSTDPGILSPVSNFEVFEEFENDGTSHIRFHEQYSGSPNAPIISYLWDFGDGTTGTGEDIVHFYNPGVYDVSLTVTDFAGLTNTQVQRVIVTEGGLSFVSEMYCFSDNNNGDYFCDVLAADKLEGLSEIVMDWGDGTTETLSAENALFSEVSFEHVYTTSGTFQAKSTTKTVRGETIVNEMTLSGSNGGGGNQGPIAQFSCNVISMTINCSGEGSVDPDGSIASFRWEVGEEGKTLNGSEIDYSYGLVGTYSVTLTVTDDVGESSSITKSFKIYPFYAFISGIPNEILPGNSFTVSAVDSILFEERTISNYHWYLNEVLISNSESVSIDFVNKSKNILKLVLEDDLGRNAEVEANLIVTNNPVAKLIVTPLKEKYAVSETVSLSSTGTLDYDGTIESLIWTLPDGTTDNSNTIHFKFKEVGDNIVKLDVIDDSGKTSSTEMSFSVVASDAHIYKVEDIFIQAGKLIEKEVDYFLPDGGDLPKFSIFSQGSLLSIDEQTGFITGVIPTVGEFEFEVTLTHGENVHKRTFKINTFQENLVETASVNNTTGEAEIVSISSEYNGMKIKYTENAIEAGVSEVYIYQQFSSAEKTVFVVKSNVETDENITITLPEGNDYFYEINNPFSFNFGKGKIETSTIYQNTLNGCLQVWNERGSGQGSISAVNRFLRANNFKKYPIPTGDGVITDVYFSRKGEDQKLSGQSLGILSNSIKRLGITADIIISNSLPSNVFASVTAQNQRAIYLNAKKINELFQNEAFLDRVLLHENRHIQHYVLGGCNVLLKENLEFLLELDAESYAHLFSPDKVKLAEHKYPSDFNLLKDIGGWSKEGVANADKLKSPIVSSLLEETVAETLRKVKNDPGFNPYGNEEFSILELIRTLDLVDENTRRFNLTRMAEKLLGVDVFLGQNLDSSEINSFYLANGGFQKVRNQTILSPANRKTEVVEIESYGVSFLKAFPKKSGNNTIVEIDTMFSPNLYSNVFINSNNEWTEGGRTQLQIAEKVYVLLPETDGFGNILVFGNTDLNKRLKVPATVYEHKIKGTFSSPQEGSIVLTGNNGESSVTVSWSSLENFKGTSEGKLTILPYGEAIVNPSKSGAAVVNLPMVACESESHFELSVSFSDILNKSTPERSIKVTSKNGTPCEN